MIIFWWYSLWLALICNFLQSRIFIKDFLLILLGHINNRFCWAWSDTLVYYFVVVPELFTVAKMNKTCLFLGAFDRYLTDLNHFLYLGILKGKFKFFLCKVYSTFIFSFIFSRYIIDSSIISWSSSNYSGNSSWDIVSSERLMLFIDTWRFCLFLPQVAKCMIFFRYWLIKFYFYGSTSSKSQSSWLLIMSFFAYSYTLVFFLPSNFSIPEERIWESKIIFRSP